tara:strand:- start:578 stop:1204 length:627 start_codon:yes stop_codon:yes gene_type:complete
MKFECYYHNNADVLVEHDEKFSTDYNEIITALKSITDKEIIEEFQIDKSRRKSTKSISKSLNRLIKKKLVLKNWIPEAALFKNEEYLKNSVTKRKINSWRLDFAKNEICVEVGFNHGEAIAHNMMKPVFASERNHLDKDIQTSLGVIITATNELKEYGNFDGAVGEFEKHIRYFLAYSIYMPTPIVLIGLQKPETFKIDNKTKEVVLL